MSKLEKLVQELCPNGVEYLTLDKVLKIKNGSDYKNYAEGNIPVYGSGGIIAYIDKFAYDKPSVLIPRKGSIDKLYYVDEPFWTVDTIFYTIIDTELVVPKFVFYCLQMQHLEKLNTAGGVPSLTQNVLNKVQLPVPPLEVQREIVRVLDSFTLLTAELTAELTARKKQYEYYRNKLLDVRMWRNDELVNKTTIGQCCDVLTGFPFDSSQFKNSGVRLMRGMNVKRGYFDFSEENNRYWSSEKGIEKYLLNVGDIIIAMDGSLVGKSFGVVREEDLPLLLVQRVARIRSDKVNMRFLYHCIAKGLPDYTEKKKTTGAVPHISQKDIQNFPLYLPSLERQEKIAYILDNFESICNDLNIGLPAEIEARKKQYEYYRDKLLSF